MLETIYVLIPTFLRFNSKRSFVLPLIMFSNLPSCLFGYVFPLFVHELFNQVSFVWFFVFEVLGVYLLCYYIIILITAYQWFSLIGPFHHSHNRYMNYTYDSTPQAHQCISTCVSLNELFCSSHFLNFSIRKLNTQLAIILTNSLFGYKLSGKTRIGWDSQIELQPHDIENWAVV